MIKLGVCAMLAAALLMSGCEQTTVTAQPEELQAGTACSLDGMLLLDYPGPKAQIHYVSGETEFFCDTTEMFSMLLQPEQRRKVTAAYTQDMGAAEWRKPVGHWIDARSAFYVKDSKLMGSMGPTFAAFAKQADAEAFIKDQGGILVKINRGPQPVWYETAVLANKGNSIAKEAMTKMYSSAHFSEWAWAGTSVDAELNNDGSLEFLTTQVRELLTDII